MRVELDSRLYARPALERALAVLAEWAEGSIEEAGGRLRVELRSKDDEISEEYLADEFANHALAEMSR